MCAASERTLFGIFFVVLLSALTADAADCGGHNITTQSFANCPDTVNVINLVDVTATINDDCNIVMNGCLKSDEVKDGTVTYEVKIDGVSKINGTEELCTDADPDKPRIMGVIDFPHECKAGKLDYCLKDKVLDTGDFEPVFKLETKKFEANIKIKHSNGETCFNMIADVS